MASASLFLLINGHLLLPTSDEMVRFAVEVASSEPDMDWRDIAGWMRRNTIPLGGNRRQAIKAVKERFDDPEEIIDRLMDRWMDITNFIMTR
jgi:hypothetical protein